MTVLITSITPKGASSIFFKSGLLNARAVPTTVRLRPLVVGYHKLPLSSVRQFSVTSNQSLPREFFPENETEKVRRTPAAWPHPIYTEEQMRAVVIAHRDAKTWSDKVALIAVRVMRWGLDLATGYKHHQPMTAYQYLRRNVFLESVAGVPGMVAGMLRHLHSMRRMKRDNGWIETLLEESYNERMHLLVFLKMMEPGLFMRLMVLGAQGVMCNAMFLAYLLSPRTVHRFVGYLEEEAVITYTRQIQDLEVGRLPEWEKLQAPQIAVDYWKMPVGKRTMRDLLLYIRADESKHRETNHTLGNLDQKEDPNPYVSEYKDDKPHPSKDLAFQKPTGWERSEVI
ncbi:alternative oxidase [Sporormia fimetaria CBS 119925]|uniref:Alternative oxidase n=1 Tax=Sporormia fimetaria CBS 119925 TaxID=1340428 RepID=A0A6A6UWM2_9PLEO|nr:alternative oxidase [Sporormia fimetaria CBS 119925]